MLLLKSDVLNARVRERPASLPSSTTTCFLLEPEDDVPEEFSVLDLWRITEVGRRLVVGEGRL